MASLASQMDTSGFQDIADNTQKAATSAKSGSDDAYKSLRGYFSGGTGDPRETYGDNYAYPLSRFGYYWKSYTDAYDKLYGATENYRDDVYNAFEDNRDYLDTSGIQDTWSQYQDRMAGYYGTGFTDSNSAITAGAAGAQGYLDDARGDTNTLYGQAQDQLGDQYQNAFDTYGQAYNALPGYFDQARGYVNDYFGQGNDRFDQAYNQYYDIINQYRQDMDPALQAGQDNIDMWQGYSDEFVRPEVYHQWQDIASGGAGSVEDFWQQSEYNKYLTDLGMESFNRQSNLGNRTYNPNEVQDFIKNTNAQEMWTAFENLQEAGQLQPELSYKANLGIDQGNQFLAQMYGQRAGNTADLSQAQAGLLPQWAGYLGQQGATLADITQNQAQMGTNILGQLAGAQQNYGTNSANMYGQQAGQLANIYGQSANVSQEEAQRLAQAAQWQANNLDQGDARATGSIANLMNQQQQQMYQHDMTQQMSDAQLQYMLTGQMPAQKIMDYRTGKTASRDMEMLLKMQKAYGDQSWDWFTNATIPNALAQTQSDADAFNTQQSNQILGAGIGAIGQIGSGLASGLAGNI